MAQPPPSYGNVMNETGKYGNPAYEQQVPYPASPAAGYGYPPPQNQYPPPAPGFVGASAPPPPNYSYGVPQQPPVMSDTDNPHPESEGRESHVLEAGASFSDKAIRRSFIRKVYLILMCQLMFTFGCICCTIFIPGVHAFMRAHSYLYYISYGTFLVTYITLVCCKGVRRKYPGNFICLIVFTVAFSYMTAMISGYYNTIIVLIAIGITAAVCIAISLFAIQTKIDFTLCSGLLFAGCMVLIFFGFACMIVSFTIGTSYILRCVYGALAALLFSLFLAYDTQALIGGRKFELSPEEYIYGSLQLYLDVVYLFLIILSFFGGKGD